MSKNNRSGILPPARALDAVMSYRFLLARTYLIVLLLVSLLALFIFSLVTYTLWKRSELANAHYEKLLADVSRQEYFVEQFEKIAPAHLCIVVNCLPEALRHGLPTPGRLAKITLQHEEPFYLLRGAAPIDHQTLNDVLSVGMRFVRFRLGVLERRNEPGEIGLAVGQRCAWPCSCRTSPVAARRTRKCSASSPAAASQRSESRCNNLRRLHAPSRRELVGPGRCSTR